MLNYIKAELWKVLHRRGVYVLLALLLLCTALFFMLYSYGGFSSLAKGISTDVRLYALFHLCSISTYAIS